MIHAGPLLSPEQIARVRRRAIFDHHKYDPQFRDVSVIAPFALAIDRATWRDLASRAEALAAEMLDAERAIARSARALAELDLPLALRALLAAPGLGAPSPTLARYVRFDFHPTCEGWRVSEANSDVPGGFIEAGGLAELMRSHHPGHAVAADPGDALAEAIARALDALRAERTVALVHATAYTDDRQVMLYLRDRLRGRAIDSVLSAPDGLSWSRGRAAAIGPEGGRRDLGGIVRFFPGEWLPSLLLGGSWWRFFRGARTPIANPGHAMISQSKRFPIACARLGLDLPAWRAALPETRDPHDRRVDVRSGEWVLKPALGRVGEDVGLPGVTPPRAWAAIVRAAERRPARWIAQRAFRTSAIETPLGAMYPCVGVFVIDGRAAGLYGRIARTPLVDGAALEAAVLIDERATQDGVERGGRREGWMSERSA